MVEERYDATARILHWLTAIIVIVMLGLGFSMVRFLETDFGLKFTAYQLHKSLGVTVFAMTVARLLWRLFHSPPPLPPGLVPWEARAAKANHWSLYALLIAMPLSGWSVVSVSTLGLPTLLFGAIPLPHIGPLAALSLETRGHVEPWIKWLHRALAAGLGGLVLIHVGATLRHQLLRRDRIFSRMWFGRGGPVAAVALAALITAGTAPAMAESWAVDRGRSKLGFETRVGGQLVKGRFARFSAAIDFDPANPEEARIAVVIEIASLSTGQTQIDQVLRGEAWFDIAHFPNAEFRATGAKEVSYGRYTLHGTLMIRGITQTLPVPFALKIRAGQAHAMARVAISRAAFGIGQGAAAGQLAVSDEVNVVLDIRAKPAP